MDSQVVAGLTWSGTALPQDLTRARCIPPHAMSDPTRAASTKASPPPAPPLPTFLPRRAGVLQRLAETVGLGGTSRPPSRAQARNISGPDLEHIHQYQCVPLRTSCSKRVMTDSRVAGHFLRRRPPIERASPSLRSILTVIRHVQSWLGRKFLKSCDSTMGLSLNMPTFGRTFLQPTQYRRISQRREEITFQPPM